jgi:hypothetical protein
LRTKNRMLQTMSDKDTARSWEQKRGRLSSFDLQFSGSAAELPVG